MIYRMKDFEYSIKRSNRKTVAIYIRDGLVEVRAPIKTPLQNIERFVALKEKWIIEKLEYTKTRFEQRESFQLDYGALLLYRGGEYPLVARQGSFIGYDNDTRCFYMPVGLTSAQIKKYAIEIYKMLAKRDIPKRVFELSEQMRLVPGAIKINSAKTRWGSCSGKKSLNFSWMLIMADDEVIDYIIVHELSHLIHMDHSTEFWSVVKEQLPDYEARRDRLKQLSYKLSQQDWK